MPIHDWTRVDAGLFHHFHQNWTTSLCSVLNESILLPEYYALVERNNKGPMPDVLAQLVQRTEAEMYVEKASHVTLRHRHGEIVSIVEIVSPGNKGSRAEFKAFVDKSASLIRHGIHLLVIDLFPPGKRDPQGIHKAIWDEFEEMDFQLPQGKLLTLASYDASGRTAYVNFVAIGDVLPDVPLFFKPEVYVPAPLEESYQTAWKHFPSPLKGLLG